MTRCWQVTVEVEVARDVTPDTLDALASRLTSSGAALAGHHRRVSAVLTVIATTSIRAVETGRAGFVDALSALGYEAVVDVSVEAVRDDEADWRVFHDEEDRTRSGRMSG